MPPDAEPDREKLRHKIQFIRDAVRGLEDIRDRGETAFKADPVLQDAAVRRLQVGIEAMLDAANHIVAREGLGLPETYRQSIELLIATGILPADHTEDLLRMVRFRNRAVHLYDTIDAPEIWEILTSHLGDFELVVQTLVRRYF